MVLDKVPDAARKDAEKAVEGAPRKQPQRWTRKEAARRAAAAAGDGAADAGASGKPSAAGADAFASQSAGPEEADDQVRASLLLLGGRLTCMHQHDRFGGASIAMRSATRLWVWLMHGQHNGCMQGMDAYEFADPADILPRLDKGFWEGLAAAKWTERRDALRSLKQLAAAPRLATGDYADVVRELRKVSLFCLWC